MLAIARVEPLAVHAVRLVPAAGAGQHVGLQFKWTQLGLLPDCCSTMAALPPTAVAEGGLPLHRQLRGTGPPYTAGGGDSGV